MWTVGASWIDESLEDNQAGTCDVIKYISREITASNYSKGYDHQI